MTPSRRLSWRRAGVIAFLGGWAAVVHTSPSGAEIAGDSCAEKCDGAKYAKLSDLAYDSNKLRKFLDSPENKDKEEWTLLPMLGEVHRGSGLDAYALVNKKGEVVISFRGTEVTSNLLRMGPDAWADLSNQVGGSPQQYLDALVYANDLRKLLPPETKITVTGHSLGGGLAQFVAKSLNAPGYVYNSDWLGPGPQAVFKGSSAATNNPPILDYYNPSDIVTGWNTWRALGSSSLRKAHPQLLGRQIAVDYPVTGSVDAHRMEHMANALAQQCDAERSRSGGACRVASSPENPVPRAKCDAACEGARYANLSSLAYDSRDLADFLGSDKNGEGWTVVQPSGEIHDKSGLDAYALKNSSGDIAIVFRGTQKLSKADWQTDLENHGSGRNPPEQYLEALLFAARVKKDVLKTSPAARITLTGHSLGGGLAQFVGKSLDLPGYVFNADWLGFGAQNFLGESTAAKNNPPFVDYVHPSDPVTRLNRLQGNSMRLVGNVQPVDYPVASTISAHLMENMTAALRTKCEIYKRISGGGCGAPGRAGPPPGSTATPPLPPSSPTPGGAASPTPGAKPSPSPVKSPPAKSAPTPAAKAQPGKPCPKGVFTLCGAIPTKSPGKPRP